MLNSTLKNKEIKGEEMICEMCPPRSQSQGSAQPADVDMNPSAGMPHSGGSPCQSGLLLTQQLWYLPRRGNRKSRLHRAATEHTQLHAKS